MRHDEQEPDQQVPKEEDMLHSTLTLEQQRREKRKAEALRANLRKRKEQQRGRSLDDKEEAK